MMSMLEKGGMELLKDGVRAPDPDNPAGYFEFEPVKHLGRGDSSWLDLAGGKAVKIISWLLMKLPEKTDCRVIFMTRDLKEVLASQAAMLDRNGRAAGFNNSEMAGIFEKHLVQVNDFMASRPGLDTIKVDFRDLIQDPGPQMEKVRRFLKIGLDTRAMLEAVQPDLYRQRNEEKDHGRSVS